MPFNDRTSLIYSLAFTSLFFLCCFFYQYFDVVNDYADGVHVWRQTDGLSIAHKYYTEGNSFLQPQMHNQLSHKGMAVGEFPVMYYLVGKLYFVFGNHVWVYRGLWWLFSFLGFFFLYKFCAKFLKNHIYGILISLFTFSSPIVIIYGISFIADPIALFLTFVSWYLLLVYHEYKKPLTLATLVFLITLSAMLKITSLLSILALGIVYGTYHLNRLIKSEIKFFILVKKVSPFVVIFAITSLWYIYANNYNKENDTDYFFLRLSPIWDIPGDRLDAVTSGIAGWLREYFYEAGRVVIYVFALLTILPFFNKHFNKSYYWFYFFSVISFISFGLLFYYQFLEHDYYAINLMFIVPLTMVFFIKKFSFLLKGKVALISFQALFAILVYMSIDYAKGRVTERFNYESAWSNKDLYELKNILPEYGISKNDLILIPHDPSPNTNLYPLDMNGWTGTNKIWKEEIFKEKIKLGAKWMLLSDKNPVNIPFIEEYKKNLVLDFKGIKIYSLK